MAPVRVFDSWNKRSSNQKNQIEPYRKYYIICEGHNTEKWYFETLINRRKKFPIHNLIDIKYLNKTDEDEHLSNPEKLIDFADKIKNDGSLDYDKAYDKMIVVFDADIFEHAISNYDEIIKKGKLHNIIGVCNPSFELFLLLHFKSSVKEIILPNKEKIIKNVWVGKGKNKRRYIEELFRLKSGLKPKKDKAICNLVDDLDIAIEQEKELNNNIDKCKGNITSNIGQIIEFIFNDKCN